MDHKLYIGILLHEMYFFRKIYQQLNYRITTCQNYDILNFITHIADSA